MHRLLKVTSIAMILGSSVSLRAGETVTIENVVDPGANRLDETIAQEFSLERAIHFIDSAALSWQKKRKCFTCHTNFAYLYARPLISSDAPAHREVRRFAEQLVSERWPKKGPRSDAEVVAAAAALAFNDAATTGKLHEQTKVALDRMWTMQREDGGWNWLKCNWPPMEQDDHYGVTLAAIAAGSAPGDYAQTDAAKEGIAGIRNYVKNNPPDNPHQQAMLLWAAKYHDGMMSDEDKQACIVRLFSLQKENGGWSAATLGDWERKDGKKQDFTTSDGYGTGFVVFVLRQADVAKTDPRLRQAVQWLRSHQRESGRWFTRSLNRDNKHFLTHAGTAFAVMALAACDEDAAAD